MAAPSSAKGADAIPREVAKAKEFYVGFLGFKVDWEDRPDGGAPVYMQVSRGGLVLHLSEHHGDCCPGSTVYVGASGVADLHAEIKAHKYPCLNPGLGHTPWGSTCMEVVDPFGNRLRFDEAREAS